MSMTFDFINADWNLQSLAMRRRTKRGLGLNVVDGAYYEIITKVGNERYEHFILPIDHIYATIDGYIKALLRNNAGLYGKSVKLVNFDDIILSQLPTKFFKVGGNY